MVYILKEPKIKKNCVYCNKEFMTNWKNAKYCSHICSNKKLKEKYHYLNKQEKKCVNCGKKFITHMSYQVYCSNKCRRQSRKFNFSNFELREYIYERDNFTCKDCGIQKGSSGELHAHHIIPMYKGGKHISENMVILCKNCHKKRHKIL